MDYKTFCEYRKEQIETGDVLDFAETNLYSYYQNAFPAMTGEITGHRNGRVHRCHLVEDWLNHYGLEHHYKKNIGVSQGVRHSLDILMKHYNDRSWYIPSDCYPVYQEKAETHLSMRVAEYETLTFSNVFRNIPTGTEIILCCAPFKPYGRKLETAEIYTLRQWLKEDRRRRIVFDCVYLFSIEEQDSILKLYNETDQVYLLFSLSKNWLIPNKMGFTFIPSQDQKEVREQFKSLNIPYNNLEKAYIALNHYQERPKNIRDSIIANIQNSTRILTEFGFIFDVRNPSYLFYSSKSPEYWFQQGILVIPATVFGGRSGSVISVLN